MIENNQIYKIVRDDLGDVRTRIVKAAIEEFAIRSLEGARTREITRKSGANLAAISYHFGGKNELYALVIRELSEYFEYVMKPYYEEEKNISKSGSSDDARALISKFLFDFIRKFVRLETASYVIIILAREGILHSKSFSHIYKSVYESPIKFLSRLIGISTNGRYDSQQCTVFAHTLWLNVRSYCSSSIGDSVLKLHGWKSFGDAEIAVLESSLNAVIEKL